MNNTDQSRAAAQTRGLNTACRILAGIACLVLFAMMVLTFVDVVGRYLFLSPLPAAYELVSLMMPAIIFCALPLTVLREGHVTVDLLDGFIPGAVARIQGVAVSLFSAVALGLITWRLGVKAYEDRYYESVTDELLLQIWPFGAAMCLLSAFATLAALANAQSYAMGNQSRSTAPR